MFRCGSCIIRSSHAAAPVSAVHMRQLRYPQFTCGSSGIHSGLSAGSDDIFVLLSRQLYDLNPRIQNQKIAVPSDFEKVVDGAVDRPVIYVLAVEANDRQL